MDGNGIEAFMNTFFFFLGGGGAGGGGGGGPIGVGVGEVGVARFGVGGGCGVWGM